MPKLINKKTRPEPLSDAAFVAIGGGKSAYFYAGACGCAKADFFILTNHPSQSTQVQSMWDEASFNSITQGSVENLRGNLCKLPPNKLIIFIATTYPRRFEEWLQKIFADVELARFFQDRRKDILFFLPHSPNDAVQFLRSQGQALIVGDYYLGIGGAEHDERTKTSYIKAQVKEESLMALENCDDFIVQHGRGNFQNILRNLSLNQGLKSFYNVEQLSLLPTNAILHLAGIAAFVTQNLAEKGLVGDDILLCEKSDEFFGKLQAATSFQNLASLVGTGLQGKKFYRDMPRIGPDILMKEISSLVCKIRKALIAKGILQITDLDLDSANGLPTGHIFNHLREKYKENFYRTNVVNAWEVSFGEFVNANPPYQNPAIIFPTNKDGTIDVKHRFFCEELPTFKVLQDIAQALEFSKEETAPLDLCIDFVEKLILDKEILPSQTVIESTARKMDEEVRSKL